MFCPLCFGPEEFHSGPAAGSAVTLTLSSSSTPSSIDIGSDGKAQKSFHIVAPNCNRIWFLLKGNLSESSKTGNCIPLFHSTVFSTCPCTGPESEPIDRVLATPQGGPSKGTPFLPTSAENISSH